MAKTSAAYWDDRASELITINDARSNKAAAQIDRVYKDAQRRVKSDIDAIYDKYSDNAGISQQELRKLLSHGETSSFWRTLEGKESQQYIKQNYKARITRLEQLGHQIHAQAKANTYPKEVKIQTKLHAETIKSTHLRTGYNVQHAGINAAFSTINKNRLDRMLRTPWEGGNYSTRIWGNTDALADDIKERLTAGLLAGQSRDRLAREIRDRFDVKAYEARRLVRTETSYFENAAEGSLYDEIGVDEYTFVATLDSRTSEICGHLDGKRFKTKDRQVGVNWPPMHPNCRSKPRAYFGDEFEPELRYIRNEDRTDPDMPYNDLAPYQNYDQWIKTVPPRATAVTATVPAANVNPSQQVGQQILDESKTDPMTIEEAQEGSNPNYKSGTGDYENNCQRAVPAYELRRRGYDVEALAYNRNVFTGTNADMKRLWNKAELGYDGRKIDAAGRIISKPIGGFIRAVKKEPVGARLQVTYKHARGRTGHTMVIERVKVSEKYPAGVRFIDPQTGLDSARYTFKGRTRWSYMRLDDAEINPELLHYIVKRRDS